MQRRKFIGIAGVAIACGVGATYVFGDMHSYNRNDMPPPAAGNINLHKDELEILYLASLAPSGHNTQPWFVRHKEPFHWVIGNDQNRWLPAVDPTQRETVLSIGAFLQNLEYAATHYGYSCSFEVVGASNQDENMVDVQLKKTTSAAVYDTVAITSRRTLRSHFKDDVIKKEDLAFLVADDADHLHFFASGSKENNWLNEQTIEANRLQTGRDAAQKELSDWIRFSSSNAEKNFDGLTTASMEISGLSGLVVRNFYGKDDVMKKSFRDKSVDQVREQVSHSGGWMVISNTGTSVALLIETGMRMQRLFLKVRSKGIALHPMTQILEEAVTNKEVNRATGMADPIQFLLRTGYVAAYPPPVSLRRPVDRFVRV